MARLALVPAAGRSVGKEGLVGEALEMDAVAADGHAHLLRLVVVSAGVEHIHAAAANADGGRLDAILLPRKQREENRGVGSLRPSVAAEVGAGRSGGHAQLLAAIVGVARGKVEIVATTKLADLGIYGPPASPAFALGRENGIRGIAAEGEPVGRNGVADGVRAPAAVGLIEEVNLSVPHQSAGSAESAALVFEALGRSQLAHFLPCSQVAALGNAYVPARSLVVWPRRNGVVHQVAAAEADDMWVLGERNARARDVAVEHVALGCGVRG